MAFMMPVMKNDWDVYKLPSNKPKRSLSQASSRSRKVSETRSECQSLATSPQDKLFSKYYATGNLNRRMRSMPASHRPSRMPSVRASQVSLPSSPSKLIREDNLPENTPGSSPKSPSDHFHKFHVRLMERLRRSLRITKDDDEPDKPDSPTQDSPK